ncbi:Smr/MutS family protein [Telmatospirillum sp. J64-1]|uniref:Smr/MutS family protein n=1 Tax=Telmatospirillum sp. J64-1 TaxID=2502183 RepID=UPI00115E0781|nr:Smr/MutS family protein [Telmatospirillum sp. J64-1]
MTDPNRRRRSQRGLSHDEKDLWRALTRDVQPLPGREDLAGPESVPPEPAPMPAAVRATPALPPPQPPAPRPASSLPALHHGATPGVDRRNADRLKKGRMAIDGRIDLHGMTQEAAHSALIAFLHRCYEADRRCVLVITGKGRDSEGRGIGVLRAAVPRWLNEGSLRQRILAFSHAQPRDGGEGALYVLLKRRRQ